MKRIIVLSLVLCFPFLVYAEAGCPGHLFHIAKSDNKNVLYYDARMKNNIIENDDPVKIYWIMYAKSGQTETMTFTEKPQFGITYKEVTPGKKYILNMRNKQLSKKDITILLEDDGCARAYTDISGHKALLESVFIQISPDSGIIPDVQYLELFGITADDEKVSEKVYP